ncbi:MAG: thiamine pyrophosphate-dependent enzyme [Actinobacteria bacterium]|nr:thiamine pyrophosphate-dependent enzyme [Actinomycetota bacterium]
MDKHSLTAGHRACAGCGEALGARLAIDAAGEDIVVANATGCLEVFSSKYPESAWGVPWIHSLFENAPAVASGMEAGLRALGKADTVRVIAQGGDGGTADIGFGALSGMFERGHDILYICYDNEAYMNTGIQRSGLTPFDARTSTSPPGERSWGNETMKKDLPAIAVAHRVPYVATASVAYPHDIQAKVKRAMKVKGPKYLQIHVPCPLGWGTEPRLTVDIAKLAVETGLFPLFEIEKGQLVRVKNVLKRKPVEEYLRPQARYRHLFRMDGGEEQIRLIQAIADANAEKYGLGPVEIPEPAQVG